MAEGKLFRLLEGDQEVGVIRSEQLSKWAGWSHGGEIGRDDGAELVPS